MTKGRRPFSDPLFSFFPLHLDSKGFVKSSVEGHKSLLAFGFLENNGKKVPVVACLGRVSISKITIYLFFSNLDL